MIIQTKLGPIDSALMKRRVVHIDNFDADGVLHDSSNSAEWWLDGELVQNDVNVVIWRAPEEVSPLLGLMASGGNGNEKEKR